MQETIRIEVEPMMVPRRIDAYVASFVAGSFSREEIKACLKKGLLLLNGRPADPSSPVKAGDVIEGVINAESKNAALIPESVPLEILYEDKWLLVVNKPSGMVVHPGAGKRSGTLVHALLGRGEPLSNDSGDRRPGIVHRLDKDVSGVLLVAKNNQAHRHLQDQFASRTVRKIYVALVHGKVEFQEGHVFKPIGPDPSVHAKMKVCEESESSKDAQTFYRVIERYGSKTLLEVQIITGRTHQIRVHLAWAGYPVVGDPVYGNKHDGAPRLALHARSIEFAHPKTGKKVKVESPLPFLMTEMITQARQTAVVSKKKKG